MSVKLSFWVYQSTQKKGNIELGLMSRKISFWVYQSTQEKGTTELGLMANSPQQLYFGLGVAK